MSLSVRWANESDVDRVAEARMLSYAHARKDLEHFRQMLVNDPRSKLGDCLLVEDGAEAVGTSTAYPFTTWVRGSPLPCQGVGFVGTIRTRRRTGSAGQGVASLLMRETLRMAR